MDAQTCWPAVPQPQALYNSPRLNSLVEDYPLAIVDMELIVISDVIPDNFPRF